MSFLFLKNVILTLKQKYISLSMYLDMKMNKYIQFAFKKVDLKTIWNYCCYKIKRNRSMLTLKILIDLCMIKQRIKKKYFLHELFKIL